MDTTRNRILPLYIAIISILNTLVCQQQIPPHMNFFNPSQPPSFPGPFQPPPGTFPATNPAHAHHTPQQVSDADLRELQQIFQSLPGGQSSNPIHSHSVPGHNSIHSAPTSQHTPPNSGHPGMPVGPESNQDSSFTTRFHSDPSSQHSLPNPGQSGMPMGLNPGQSGMPMGPERNQDPSFTPPFQPIEPASHNTGPGPQPPEDQRNLVLRQRGTGRFIDFDFLQRCLRGTNNSLKECVDECFSNTRYTEEQKLKCEVNCYDLHYWRLGSCISLAPQ